MSSSRAAPRRLVLGACLLAVALGCERRELVSVPRTAVNHTLFHSYVALGNSITAGFQSAGIVDSTQAESYAALLAHQAGTRYAFPALRVPGCPPPVVNFQTGARLDAGTATTCALRDPSSVTAALNNVAVPGAASIDPISLTSANSNVLTELILGGKTQVQRALEAAPTFVSVWIGNNDVLPYALSGFATGQPTPVDTFNSRYDAMMQQLTSGQKGLKGILIGVVDVTQIPSIFPVDSLISNVALKAEFDAAAGTPTAIQANCIGAHALVSIEIIAAIQAHEVPPAVSCTTTDPFTLDAVKQAVVSGSVAAYNAHISTAAATAGFAFVDVNPILAQLKSQGAIYTTPNFLSPTNPFGLFFTLDGIHPSALAHQYLVNVFIKAINTKYGAAIDTVGHQ
jgi:lysophospholipase L1-like esterase